MIGRTVTFIRREMNGDRGIKTNHQYQGIVLDKFTRMEYLEARWMKMDYYQVELPQGILAQFYCYEAVRIEPENKQLN